MRKKVKLDRSTRINMQLEISMKHETVSGDEKCEK